MKTGDRNIMKRQTIIHEIAIPPVMPVQPVHIDNYGVARFVANRIVRKLLDDGPFDMNQIAKWDVTPAEHEQFAQLIGYSISGAADLDYVSDRVYNKGSKRLEKLESANPRKKDDD